MIRLRYAAPLTLLAALAACSDNSRSRSTAAAAPPPPAAMAQPTMPPMSPDLIRQVQTKLKDAGYYKRGRVDGVWGRQTENSVRDFQKDHNLNATGTLDLPTLQAMDLTSTSQAGTTGPGAAPPPPPPNTSTNTAPPTGTAPPASMTNPAGPPPR